MRVHISKVLVLVAIAAISSGCGSSGGTSTPPAPPAPVTPPPPPPEPTFEQRLRDLAAHDRNPCRALSPGFEAFGGWIKNDGRELAASRLWQSDSGSLADEDSHGFKVRQTLDECAVRELGVYLNNESIWDVLEREKPEKPLVWSVSTDRGRAFDPDYIWPGWTNPPNAFPELLSSESDYEYDVLKVQSLGNWGFAIPRPLGDGTSHAAGRQGIVDWIDENVADVADEDERERWRELAQGWIPIAEKYGWRLPTTSETSQVFLNAVESVDTALWLLVGGYQKNSSGDYEIHPHSSVCGKTGPLCLFGQWTNQYAGTSNTTPQIAAGLDAVLAIWPDMPLLDVRNLAMECAQYQGPPTGSDSSTHTVTTTEFTYSTGRASSYRSNEWWGAGVFSLTCLFTPNGSLRDRRTDQIVSGGIYGPLAGVVTGASITGMDYTGRDFSYGFARPVARENFALAATANLRPAQAIPGAYGPPHARGAYSGRLWQRGEVSVDLTAAAPRGGAGNAIGAAVQWQAGGLILRGGIAAQPEGVGSLTGSRAFRAPSAVSAAVTAAYGRALPHGFAAHLQADHWRTLATAGRSLWENAELSESRFSAALLKRAGRHEVSLQGVWRSGLAGSLQVSGRSWAVSPAPESGVWLSWKLKKGL